ncbi:MAG TPA: alpha/beta fold hydrolase [Longimicrobiaceae bacterium]|nr:alpha/beta fold hydrolase [Longimicrobiaceae bacterium]
MARRHRGAAPSLKALALVLLAGCGAGGAPDSSPAPAGEHAQLVREVRELRAALERFGEAYAHQSDVLERQADNLLLFDLLGDVAEIDAITFTGPPPAHRVASDDPGANNPLKVRGWVFVPRGLDRTRRHPLIVLPHGGVHAHFTTASAGVVRELVEQGYTVVAPDYRGSTGYGRGFQEQIDYGGLETEDTHAARQAALDRYPFLDPRRVGIVGWSHGGLHALMNVFDHPEAYAAAYAGVPVSDLLFRLSYKSPAYTRLFSAPYHVGKTPQEDPEAYRRRSPAYQAHRYRGTPLLIHTTTNDEDVYAAEVHRLVEALRAAGTPGWHFKEYRDAPGGHAFNRIDTPLARESRREIYRFLAPHLKPARPAELAALPHVH